jgi:hypothetical protein
MKGAQILYGKLVLRERRSEHNVINMQEEVHGITVTLVDEHGGVRLSLSKAQGEQIGAKLAIPSTKGTLQIIEGFVELIDMSG